MDKKKFAKYFREMLTYISPKLNTKVCYRIKFGKKLDLKNPKTLNEKILWLKLNRYLNDPIVKKCADKYRVREYVESLGCKEILNELIKVYDFPCEISWNELPESFAMKLNVGCGANLICSNKEKLDKNEAFHKIENWFKEKYYIGYSEMQYKGSKYKIIVEKYLGINDVLPEDYKFICINGKAEYVMVCLNRGSKKKVKYCLYDRNWNWCKFDTSCKNDPNLEKPELIARAFEYADKLSSKFPFVRIDFYIVDKKIYFGEFTFTPCGGLDNSILPEVDEALGKKIVL